MMKQLCGKAIKFIVTTLTLLSCGATSNLWAAKLAVVIDDIGYRNKDDDQIYAMPKEISVAIIPAAPYAKQRNELAKQQDRDILIHMPMQPVGGQKIETGGLKLGLTEEEVKRRVETAHHIVSHAIGMNNHMGSAATADRTLMGYLMKSLKQKQLSFLDSRTSGRSVASQTAKQFGIHSLERHIFLDDSDALTDVQHQFQKAINYSQKYGVAIVIGHPRKNTIAVLQTGLKNLPKDVELVPISQLWQQNKATAPLPFIYLFNNVPAPTSIAPYLSVPTLRGIPK